MIENPNVLHAFFFDSCHRHFCLVARWDILVRHCNARSRGGHAEPVATGYEEQSDIDDRTNRYLCQHVFADRLRPLQRRSERLRWPEQNHERVADGLPDVAQQHVEAVFAQLGLSKTTATSARTIFLASQGLQFLELLGLLSLSTAERNEIRRHLKALTEELAPC